MTIAQFSVHRPIFTIMVVLIVVLLGGVSLWRLPIDLMPDISYPTLSVSCAYENASPEEVEELIARPIEEAISAVPGVEEVTSTSSEGAADVRILFSWGTDLDAAANDVRDRMDRVIPRLPENADRPVLRKFDLASFPILILGASSRLDPVEMRRIIDDEVSYRIERVPGVAAVDVWGGLEREIHVALNPDKVNALAVPFDEIVSRIAAGNVNVPAGTIDRGNFQVTIRTPGEYVSLEEIEDTVVATHGGVPIRLRQIANVEDSWQKVTRIVRVNGEPGLRMSVSKQSGKNTVEVARAALEAIEAVNRDIPQISIIPIIDTSDYIQRSISSVGSSAAYGGALAVVVLLLFLRNVRSTVVIALAIPISIVATFALMYFGGFTLNLMTLGGLALGTGMLVDNSIVVLENIYRLREGGAKPEAAAVNGTAEVTAAIISSTLTTVAVFLPLIFIRGMSGVMFKQLSIVVSFSLLCSLAVALTVVPMLSARILSAAEAHPQSRWTLGRRLFEASGGMFKRLELEYKAALHFALGHRLIVVIGSAAVLGGSLALIPLVGVELMPSADEGEVRISAEMQVGTRLDLVDRKMKQVEAIVRASVPEAKSVVSSVGGSPFRGAASHVADMRIALVSQSERRRSSEEVAADLRQKLSRIPGLTIRTRAGQGLFILRMGTQDADKVQVEVRGHDLDTADALAEKVKRIVEDVPGVTDAQISRESGTPEELILIDRAKADDLKLTPSAVAGALQMFLSGTTASQYRQEGDEYAIVVKLKDPEQMALKDILDLALTNADGEPVVLRNVVNVATRSGPVQIERKDQERVTTISANLSGRDMGSVLADIRKGLDSVPVPQSFGILFGGDFEEQQKAFRELLLSISLALVLVYMVMACQYESLRDPFVVMFSVPLAAIGVILTLFFTKTTFNIQSYIGCIMLGGIVVNNAILLVDHTNLLRRRDGMALREAIEEAGRRRLRPILMTALTTILGLLPLALGMGEGGEAQAPLARAVIGGLFSSTAITLVFVPVMYSVFERRMTRSTEAAPAEA